MQKEVYVASASHNLIESGDVKPCGRLKSHIESYWYVITNVKLISPLEISITSDGSFNIVMNLSLNRNAGPMKIYGISESRISLTASGKTCLLGIKFLPGGILSFMDIHASDFKSNSFNLSDVIGARVNELYERLMTADNIHDKILFLENYFIDLLNKNDRRVPPAIEQIKNTFNGNKFITGDMISQLSCVCERQTRRLFSQYIGTGPKEFVRMLRIQNAIHLLAIKKHMDFKELALVTGHYDQSHFIKEFKKFTGITPLQFKQKLSAK
ncbi:MAG TPA: helix-turn-helix domain-containing protein [Candidatus Wallbacteria bacterium]|nr:helix-turn-helix domain-containing protein [Candidatus Wallbacteria bacterium]